MRHFDSYSYLSSSKGWIGRRFYQQAYVLFVDGHAFVKLKVDVVSNTYYN